MVDAALSIAATIAIYKGETNMGHNIPWELIISVVVAVLGSSGL